MGPSKIKIVRLDGVLAPFHPTFSFPHDYVEHPATKPSEVPERIQDADVVISTRAPISSSDVSTWASSHSRPKLLAAMAIGTDPFDLIALKEHSIQVSNVPAASNEAVAEHAIALFFAARRKVAKMHEITVEDQTWMQNGTTVNEFGPLPNTCRSEVLGIVGAGDLGNRVAVIGRALGMTVLLAERKDIPDASVRPDRAPFSSVLSQSTVLVMTCPLDSSTRGMISTAELQSMRRDAVLINVARGGVVVEAALVQALKEGWISGAATDVFVEEPAGVENSVLVRALREDRALNLTISPHIAWYAWSSVEKLQRTVIANIEAFVTGEAQNVVI